jgi:UTP--glucose-1-phosphate uridylyltransferase
MNLQHELTQVDPRIQARVRRARGLTETELCSLTTRPDADPAMYHPFQADSGDVIDSSDITALNEAMGDRAILEGEVAFCILAGGVGTRMGTPKAFAKIPGVNTSLLAWKIMQGGGMPTWIMTSAGGMSAIAGHMRELVMPPNTDITLFEQFEGYRLTPDNRLARTEAGHPILYPLGHGDVGPALVESGVLDDHPKVKWVVVANVDNVMGSPHAGLIGRHIVGTHHVTCELVQRERSDRGGVLAWVNERLQIAEDFRLPNGFAEAALYHNTNTMIFNVEALRWPIPWRWHRVAKRVGAQQVIQYERLLQQYTEECDTAYVRTPRPARYMAVKTPDDLVKAGELLTSYQFKR